MSILLYNATLVHLDPLDIEQADLRLENGRIAARGISLPRQPDDERFDCGGAVVLPGFVNGHTHLYSALATGMPPPRRPLEDFLDILKYVWWRLDQALDAEAVETSARIGAIEALRCGTTTLVDHHASPNCIDGSLDRVRRGIETAGLRGVLCYETTDRHGREGRSAGLEENRRFLECCANRPDGRVAGLVGAHASFTLEDEALGQVAALAADYDSGVHIHVAEDPCDENDCQARFQMFLIDRLAAHALLQPDSVFAHCTHLDPEAIERVNAAGLTVAHNPRSNMHNAVGYAPVGSFRCPVMLGTDGLGGDMFAEARAAWLISRHEDAGLSPMDILAMSAAAARRASAALGVTVGKLEPGAAADIVITDYVPATPITQANLIGHLLFGMTARNVRSVLAGGEWHLRDRVVQGVDEGSIRAGAREVSTRLWERLSSLPA